MWLSWWLASGAGWEQLFRFDLAEWGRRRDELLVEGAKLVREALAAQVPVSLPVASRPAGKQGLVRRRLRGKGPVPSTETPEAEEFFNVLEWVSAEARGNVGHGEPLPSGTVVISAVMDRGIALLPEGVYIAVGKLGTCEPRTPRGEDKVVDDLRTLPVAYWGDSTRGRPFPEAVGLCVQRASLRTGSSRGRGHYGCCSWPWLHRASRPFSGIIGGGTFSPLRPVTLFVDDHLFLSELLGTALVYDQLNIPDLAAFEMAARRYQLYKEIYANSLRSAEGGEGADLWLDERQLCLGHDRSRGKALVCPELEACVASQSSVLKERRMGREELSLASGAGGDRNEGGGAARARVDARGRGRGRA